jgi:hypothetical protein
MRRLSSRALSISGETDRMDVVDLSDSSRFLIGDGDRVLMRLGDGELDFSRGVTDRERCLAGLLSRLLEADASRRR